MIFPPSRVVFDNVSSRDYYKNLLELSRDKLDGCVRVEFPDFEGIVFFSGGEPATALQESDTGIVLGEEFIEPVENKAVASDGKMSAMELPGNILSIFLDRKVITTIETELSQYVSPASIAKQLKKDRSTCVIKFQDRYSRGYVFVFFGLVSGSTYISGGRAIYGDDAMSAMGAAVQKGAARAYLFFIEEKEGRLLRGAAEEVAKPAVDIGSIASGAVGPLPRVQTAAERTRPVVKLRLVQSSDKTIAFARRQRLEVFEALESRSVAWVDRRTLVSLGLDRTRLARIKLSSGREYKVIVAGASAAEGQSFLVLPKKIRKVLSLKPGTEVEIRA